MSVISIYFVEADNLAYPLILPHHLTNPSVNEPTTFTLEYQQATLSQHQLETQIHDQHILVVNDLTITPVVLANNPNLKLVALCGTGYEHQDLPLLQSHGTHLCNATDYAYHSIAEHAFMLMITLLKNTLSYTQAVQQGEWSASPYFCYLGKPLYELYAKTLVIIGKGKSGQSLAQKAIAFGMKVIFSERKNAPSCRTGYVPFAQAMAMADIVSLHCELNAETENLLDVETLALLKPTAYVINIARGKLVCDTAIMDALQHNSLAGYATDVLSVEPPPINHPLLTTPLPNLIITPHIAWATQEAQQRLVIEIRDNICQFLLGNPQNLVI